MRFCMWICVRVLNITNNHTFLEKHTNYLIFIETEVSSSLKK